MTYLMATSFFDEINKWMGYILASDKVVGEAKDFSVLSDRTKITGEFENEKVFTGRNYIGLFAGAFLTDREYQEELQLLDDQFNDLNKKSKYKKIRGLDHTLSTTLLIAKRTMGRVELYTLNKEKDIWKPQILHKGDEKGYKAPSSIMWTGPYNETFNRVNIKKRLSPTEAQLVTFDVFMKRNKAGDLPYDLGEPQLYYIAPNMQGRIKDGQLEKVRD